MAPDTQTEWSGPGIIPETILTQIVEDLEGWVRNHQIIVTRFTGNVICDRCKTVMLDEDDYGPCPAVEWDPEDVEILRASDDGNSALPPDDVDYALVTIDVEYDGYHRALYGVGQDGRVSCWQS